MNDERGDRPREHLKPAKPSGFSCLLSPASRLL